ncbi:MAG: aminotransferase class I/II-fold pyridoxal phosphate-dependent enzyme [Opitutales bacterium]
MRKNGKTSEATSGSRNLLRRAEACLAERGRQGIEREVRPYAEESGALNLANNDYLELAHNPEVVAAGKDALSRYGTSSSASPLITGFGPAHEALLDALKAWYGAPSGLLWNTGYAANQAVLGNLPERGDIVLADRLVHNSMLRGILASGARLVRYRHRDMEHLEDCLRKYSGAGAQIFLVSETIFSMDGDAPDLKVMAELKQRYGAFWVLDEAHALGWYGSTGSGLAEEAGVREVVDVLVGTLGKALASMGAFTMIRDARIARYLVNVAGEFIYSTYLAPSCAAVATVALQHIRSAPSLLEQARANARAFRLSLRELGLSVVEGDSPVVPIPTVDAASCMDAGRSFAQAGVRVGAIRPPTVPAGGSRLRLSLKAQFGPRRQAPVLELFKKHRKLFT